MSHIPAGFHTVTPYLFVDDAEGFLKFVAQAFGAQILFAGKDPDGRVSHAEFALEGSIVELSGARGEWQPRPIALHVFVPNADEAHARAVRAGATSTYAPTTHPYGERSGGVRDRWGNDWFLATLVDPEKRKPS